MGLVLIYLLSILAVVLQERLDIILLSLIHLHQEHMVRYGLRDNHWCLRLVLDRLVFGILYTLIHHYLRMILLIILTKYLLLLVFLRLPDHRHRTQVVHDGDEVVEDVVSIVYLHKLLDLYLLVKLLTLRVYLMHRLSEKK